MAYELAKAYVSVGVPLGGLRSGLNKAGMMLRKAVFSWRTLLATAMGGGAAGIGAKWAIGLASNLEQAEVAFNVIIKDLGKTKVLLADLNKFSVSTPFEPTEVRAAAQRLVGQGMEIKDVMPVLKALGDLAAGVGGDLNQLAIGYTKVMEKGKATMEGMERFTTQAVPMMKILEDSGLITGNLATAMSKGNISLELFTKAMKMATAEGGLFFGAMIKQSTTLKGLWSTLKGDIDALGEVLGKALLPTAKAFVGSFDGFVKSTMPMVQSWANKMAKSLEGWNVKLETFFSRLQAGLPLIFDLMKTELALISVDAEDAAIRIAKAMRGELTGGIFTNRFSKAAFEKIFAWDVKQLEISLDRARKGMKGAPDDPITALNTARFLDVRERLAAKKKQRDEFMSSYGTAPADLTREARDRNELFNLLDDRARSLRDTLKGMFTGKANVYTEARIALQEFQSLQGLTRTPFGTGNVLIPDKPSGPSMLDRAMAFLTSAMANTGMNLRLGGAAAGGAGIDGGSPWGGRMGFDQLNNAMQDAMNQQDNPVMETNNILEKKIHVDLEAMTKKVSEGNTWISQHLPRAIAGAIKFGTPNTLPEAGN